MLRILYYLDNRQIFDVSRALLLRNICVLLVLIYVRDWVHPQDLVHLEGLGKLIIFIHLIGSRTHEFQACSRVLQPLRYLLKGSDDGV
jgi:hypothetical protein